MTVSRISSAPLGRAKGPWPAALVVLFILLASAVHAQDAAREGFGEVIDVTVINLEVVVTDEDGRPVGGLGPDDFVLVVDGEEVPIEYFSEVREGRAVAGGSSDAPAEPDQPEEAGTSPQGQPGAGPAPVVAAGEEVGTSFLVFVDNFFALPRDRDLVLDELRLQVSRLGPDDRVAVVTFDGRQLEMVGGWSSSQAEIAESLERARGTAAYGAQRQGEENLFALELSTQGTGLIAESPKHTIEERVRQLGSQVESVLRAATTTLRTFAQPPGRKVMLLLSGGWPRDPSTYVAGLDAEIRSRTRRFSPREAHEALVSTANLLGYTLYPIDLPGLQTRAPTAGDRGDRIPDLAIGVATLPDSGGAQPDPPPVTTAETRFNDDRAIAERELDRIGREQEVEATLLTLAEETGGKALLNGQRLAAMDGVLADLDAYYWLGFSPRRARDDRRHEVRVEVRRAGLETRSRSSFKDLSRQAEVTMMVESSLLFATDLGGRVLEVEVGELQGRGRKARLPVALRIPLDEVVMLPVGEETYEARLELRVASLDDEGGRSEIPVVPVSFSGPEPPPGAHAVYETELQLRSGRKQRLVLSLYDLVGEKILTSTIAFEPEG